MSPFTRATVNLVWTQFCWLTLVALAVGLPVALTGAVAAEPQPAAEKPPVVKTPVEKTAEKPAAADEWAVKGRVVDHLGAPVSNAEVLLLGEERLIVDAGDRTWFASRTEGGMAPNPPSTRTDAKGEFSIVRGKGAPNRLAVIAKDPILWLVSREKLAGDKVEIKLPASGSIAVDLELPGKPVEQPVLIELRTFDGVEWNGDFLRFHFGTMAKNPGETLFEHLPPATYAVDRNQETKTGEREMLMTPADRKLVRVESEQRATVRIDRKIGRPLKGQVRGLEDADLRYAHVSIEYIGPEEGLWKGKPYRPFTAFDVIPITSQGDFTTDPIPPGEYWLRLTAMRSTSSTESPQRSDFEGKARVTVPAEGDLPTVELIAKARQQREVKEIDPLRVVDEQGKPVPKFEIKISMGDYGDSPWLVGGKGTIAQNQPLWGFDRSGPVDVTVRADGYVSTVSHFAGDDLDHLKQGKAKIVMPRGEEVQIAFHLPPGMTWPEDLKPELYFDGMKQQVRMMWQPMNRRPGVELPDFNVLNAHFDEPAAATVRLSADTAPFRVAIHWPGFLRCFERGPFTLADVKHGKLDIEIEEPATLDVQFDPGADLEKLPFDGSTLSLMWKLPGAGASHLVVATSESKQLQHALRLDDLPAGEYRVTVRTKARPGIENLPETLLVPINPGAFHATKKLTLEAGQSEKVAFAYTPLDLDAFHGDRTAILHILKPDGSAAAGHNVDVTYYEGHYGGLKAFSGVVPESGVVTLAGVTDRAPEGVSEPYTVFLDKQPVGTHLSAKQIGRFGFAADATTPEFTFRLPPEAGDVAPDIELVNMASGATARLSDFRGKVVLLDFWATWCGPCQEPMGKMNQLAAENRETWKDRAVIVPLSIDDTVDPLKQHVARRGWTNLEHYWAGHDELKGFEAPAARAFVVSGVPTSLIIDRDGKILWRGHPADSSDGKTLIERIQAALEH